MKIVLNSASQAYLGANLPSPKLNPKHFPAPLLQLLPLEGTSISNNISKLNTINIINEQFIKFMMFSYGIVIKINNSYQDLIKTFSHTSLCIKGNIVFLYKGNIYHDYNLKLVYSLSKFLHLSLMMIIRNAFQFFRVLFNYHQLIR